MHHLATLLLCCLLSVQLSAQTDPNGNPVFNSITTGEQSFKDCLLISNYYTLDNNVANASSSLGIYFRSALFRRA